MYVEAALGQGRTIWRSAGSTGAVIPADGCVDLILRGDVLHLAGPSTTWIGTVADDENGTLGLRFPPGAAADVLRVDLAEVSDQLVLTHDLVGHHRAGRLRELLLKTSDAWPSATALLGPAALNGSSEHAWDTVIRAHARRGTSPARVAAALGWSPRTFRRRMLFGFGYPYPTLVRIERAHRARALLRGGGSLAEAAARAGYADQPHLSREFRRLVGTSPGQFASSSAKRSTELPSGSSNVA
jgi:AraC-like DNA-binding protein